LYGKSLIAQVPPVLQADFSYSQPMGCPGLVVNFQDSSLSDSSLTGWTWDFGDSTGATVQNPQHTYKNPGLYSVRLKVANQAGQEDSIIKHGLVWVGFPPKAGFMMSGAKGCAPFALHLSDQSSHGSGNLARWDWDFGNGNTDTTQHPTYTFNFPGTYQVKLRVTSTDGCYHEIQKQVEVRPSPQAYFTSPARTQCENREIQFIEASPDSTVSYYWTFGDGTFSNKRHPRHAYKFMGAYDVGLSVTDTNGCIGAFSRTRFANVKSAPHIDFSSDKTHLYRSGTVRFQNRTYSVSRLKQWTWYSGAGQTSPIHNPAFHYAHPGHYDVTLIVENRVGCKDTLTRKAFIKFDIPILNPKNITIHQATDTGQAATFKTVEFQPTHNGGVKLNFPQAKQGIYKLEVRDIQGRLIWKKAISSYGQEVRVDRPAHLASGRYYIRAFNGQSLIGIQAVNW
ncbi:MAG: PKD domain-containing protein, partial [Bacteroidota bacterium]